jgi:hypothetical protein
MRYLIKSYTQIVDRHEMIYLSKKYNFEKCLLPVKSGINIDFFQFMLTDYEDKEICRFLKYGYYLNRFCVKRICIRYFIFHITRVKNFQNLIKQ